MIYPQVSSGPGFCSCPCCRWKCGTIPAVARRTRIDEPSLRTELDSFFWPSVCSFPICICHSSIFRHDRGDLAACQAGSTRPVSSLRKSKVKSLPHCVPVMVRQTSRFWVLLLSVVQFPFCSTQLWKRPERNRDRITNNDIMLQTITRKAVRAAGWPSIKNQSCSAE